MKELTDIIIIWAWRRVSNLYLDFAMNTDFFNHKNTLSLPLLCFAFVLALLFVSLVQAAEQSETPATAAATDHWSLLYRVHGGFSGMRQELTLDQEGKLKVVNEKDYKIITRLLPERRINEVSNMLDSLHKVQSEDEQDEENEKCRDCIRHDLSFIYAGKAYHFYYQTGQALSNELEAVLSYLSNYLQKSESPM